MTWSPRGLPYKPWAGAAPRACSLFLKTTSASTTGCWSQRSTHPWPCRHVQGWWVDWWLILLQSWLCRSHCQKVLIAKQVLRVYPSLLYSLWNVENVYSTNPKWFTLCCSDMLIMMAIKIDQKEFIFSLERKRPQPQAFLAWTVEQ